MEENVRQVIARGPGAKERAVALVGQHRERSPAANHNFRESSADTRWRQAIEHRAILEDVFRVIPIDEIPEQSRQKVQKDCHPQKHRDNPRPPEESIGKPRVSRRVEGRVASRYLS